MSKIVNLFQSQCRQRERGPRRRNQISSGISAVALNSEREVGEVGTVEARDEALPSFWSAARSARKGN